MKRITKGDYKKKVREGKRTSKKINSDKAALRAKRIAKRKKDGN